MTNSVHDLLSKIQKELKAPKGQFNAFGKYKYRSCEDIVEAVKPLLDAGHLTISDEIVLIGERYYIKATARLSLGVELIEASALAREPDDRKGMDLAQVTGASSSYARKYSLNGLFAIDDTKDADTNEVKAKEDAAIEKPAPPRPQGKQPSEKQLKLAIYLRNVTGAKVSDEQIKGMDIGKISVFIEKLNKKKEELESQEPKTTTDEIPW